MSFPRPSTTYRNVWLSEVKIAACCLSRQKAATVNGARNVPPSLHVSLSFSDFSMCLRSPPILLPFTIPQKSQLSPSAPLPLTLLPSILFLCPSWCVPDVFSHRKLAFFCRPTPPSQHLIPWLTLFLCVTLLAHPTRLPEPSSPR